MVAFNEDQARATGRALPQPLHLANEGLAFLLELAMIAGLAWWGSQAVSGLAGRVALAILTPVAAVIVWALLAAPKARIRLPLPGVLAVKAVVFAGAAVAVYSTGQHALAIGFAVVTAVNTAVAAVDRQALATRAGLPDPPEELPQVGDQQVRGMDTAHQWPKRYGGHDILTPRGEYEAGPGQAWHAVQPSSNRAAYPGATLPRSNGGIGVTAAPRDTRYRWMRNGESAILTGLSARFVSLPTSRCVSPLR